MPCRDEISPTGYGIDWEARGLAKKAIEKVESTLEKTNEINAELKKSNSESQFFKHRLDAVTANLCFVMRVLKSKHPDVLTDVLINPSLEAWWEEHQKMDEQRNNLL